MPRADLILNLVRAGSRGDDTLFRRSVEALVAEERSKNHHVLADRLLEYSKAGNVANAKGLNASNGNAQDLIIEVKPRRTLNDLLLTRNVRQVSEEVVEEHHRADLLRSYNLEPRHRVLLVGPPGNGKTSLAEALAEAMFIPLLVVRYEGVIGSFLGETAVRLSRLFEYVRTRQCVLFFDEFDTLGKERGDTHETGEIKRVVSSLLLQIDALPSYVVVVTATNHPELLDRAVWRRFQVKLLLPPPEPSQISEWLNRFEDRFGQKLGHAHKTLVNRLFGLSFAELEEFSADVQRRYVLHLPDANVRHIVSERLDQLEARFRDDVAGGIQE